MQKNIELRITNPLLEQFGVPKFQTEGSAGVDLRAMFLTAESDDVAKRITIPAGEVVRIGTGVAIDLNDASLAAFLVPRSGLGSKGITLANTIGIIDSDYQGEIIAMIKNTSNVDVEIEFGDRIAQLLFVRVEQPTFTLVESFTRLTERGENGFNSTGVK